MKYEVKRITNGPKHHLFGFHDLVQANAKGDLLLSLEVDDISRPPLPGESCGNGAVSIADGEFHEIGRTHTWNYPMGSRQQWIGDSDLYTCNDRADDGRLISKICDARAREEVETLPFPIHALNAQTRKAFYFDFNRIYSVGGYGYVHQPKTTRLVDLPKDDGLWIGDMQSGKSELMASIYDIASCGEKHPVKTGYPHYVTHLMLNPAGNRFLFLHRYRVADGGEITRLMTVGADGSNMRCLAKGGESHFTWLDDETIFIWGEDGRRTSHLRELPIWRVPGVLAAFKVLKGVRRKMLDRRYRSNPVSANRKSSSSFLLIKDTKGSELHRTGVGVLTENGHPMACPSKMSWLVNDTYPDESGDRILMFYDVVSEKRFDIGKFRMVSDRPDETKFDWRLTMAGVDPRIERDFNRGDYLFFRSGLHCDLHPRWSYDGRVAYFDSIHEGTRQIYSVEVIDED